MKDKKKLKLEAKMARKATKQARKEERRANSHSVITRQYLDLPTTIELLEKTVEDLKAGAISLEQGSESLHLTPPNHVRLKVTGKSTPKKESVSLSVSWPTATS